MNRAEALREGKEKLRFADFSEADLEAEVLLRHVLKINRAGLFSSLYENISSHEYTQYLEFLNRRLQNEPLTYIIRYREFYGLGFYVDSRVLIPRPETEMLVEEAIRIGLQLKNPVVCDVGTGSGAIAISLAKNLPQAKIYGIDINNGCIQVARKNAILHEVEDRINFITGDLLTLLPEPVDLIVANLPYVKQSDVRNVPGEPVVALDGGYDGLNVIRRLVLQVGMYIKQGCICLLEIGENQDREIQDFIECKLPDAGIKVSEDFAGINRMITITLP
ncbi:MAG: peptide chain release factor N(5)-glutamine methyltransferase [Dehalococcoidales bacterium]|nr:peptide chain release factor N(5)-glutamine methyltransferase [Dehalococcoidales bacterium]